MSEQKFIAVAAVALATALGSGSAAAQEGQPYQPPPPPDAQPQYPPQYPPPDYQGKPLPTPNYQPPAPVYQPPPRQVLRYEMRPRYGLIIAGAVTLGVTWGITAGTAALIQDTCVYGDLNCQTTPRWALYIPVAGPFIQLGYESSAIARAGLVFDGLVQGGALAMLIAGGVARKRVPIYAGKVQITPYAMGSGSGLLVSGRF